MTAVIIALLYVTFFATCFVWLGVVEDRIEADRQARKVNVHQDAA